MSQELLASKDEEIRYLRSLVEKLQDRLIALVDQKAFRQISEGTKQPAAPKPILKINEEGKVVEVSAEDLAKERAALVELGILA